VTPERIDALSREIERICGLLDRCSPDTDQAASAITDFNAMTGHAYADLDFAEYYASRNLRDFALEAATRQSSTRHSPTSRSHPDHETAILWPPLASKTAKAKPCHRPGSGSRTTT
jgi:hypothetical protein